MAKIKHSKHRRPQAQSKDNIVMLQEPTPTTDTLRIEDAMIKPSVTKLENDEVKPTTSKPEDVVPQRNPQVVMESILGMLFTKHYKQIYSQLTELENKMNAEVKKASEAKSIEW